jgi:hypothetical protein
MKKTSEKLDTKSSKSSGLCWRNTKDGHFLWINQEAFKRVTEQSAGISMVYAALCSLESSAPPHCKASFAASLGNIAKSAGVDKKTVTRAIKILEKIKLIKVKRPRKAAAMRGEANLYTLLPVYNADIQWQNSRRDKTLLGTVSKSKNGPPNIKGGYTPFKGNDASSAAVVANAPPAGSVEKKGEPDNLIAGGFLNDF